MWLSGEEHSSRGYHKGKDLEGRVCLASSRLSKEAKWPERNQVGQSWWYELVREG